MIKDTIYYAIDVETTGLSPFGGDRVIECAAVKIYNSEIVSEFSTLINVPCTIHPQAQAVHGITKKMLDDKPEPSKAWPLFMDFIGKAPLIAHNARFDRDFIRSELDRLGKKLSNKSICTLRLARRKYPLILSHRLESVARNVLGKIPVDCRLHRALGDARLVAYIWVALKGKR